MFALISSAGVRCEAYSMLIQHSSGLISSMLLQDSFILGKELFLGRFIAYLTTFNLAKAFCQMFWFDLLNDC